MAETKRVLVLFSFRNHKTGYYNLLFDRLTKYAKTQQLQLDRGSLKDLQVCVKESKLRVVDGVSGKDLKEFDLVYFELWSKGQQPALAAATYLKRCGIPFFSQELQYVLPITKLGELSILSDQGIPLPDSICTSATQFRQLFAGGLPPLAYPLIVKNIEGYGGKINYLVTNFAELDGVLKDHADITFVAQQFIPNDFDYRCVVMGGRIQLVIKRQRAGGHLNNTSRGSIGALVEPKTLGVNAQRDVIRAAKLLHRGEFSGVDLVIDKHTGQHYILEVNKTPQIEIGSNIDAKMETLLKYMAQRAKS